MKRSKVIAFAIVAVWVALCIKWWPLIPISVGALFVIMFLGAMVETLSNIIDSTWPDGH